MARLPTIKEEQTKPAIKVKIPSIFDNDDKADTDDRKERKKSKIIEKFHKLNPKILRLREMNR